ncbi:MAG: DUF362 domain-containing protein [Clostridiales bacterium]|jgi:uncharacterized protein (DUF362 family)/Pyruvate/2-oxoacid:ferredoxin oxidoreductase delta subunit|nr:DUF362 domain-containing protein [Clostridiales bacterium]
MVYIKDCHTYERSVLLESVREIFTGFGGIEKYVFPNKTVVIKPNLVTRKNPDDAATTHPNLVWAVAKLCSEQGAKVIIADSPGGLFDKNSLKIVYKGCGMEEAADDPSVELNYDTAVTTIDNQNALYLKKIKVVSAIAKADVIINIAKLKTHGMMAYTGAVKNMFGVVPGLDKTEYHFKMQNYDDFANGIIDICLSVNPTFNIIDGIIGMERDGPTAGDPKEVGVLIAGENPFECDLAALGIIKADPLRIPVLKNAIKRGLCQSTYKELEIKGRNIEECQVDGFIVHYVDDHTSIIFFRGPISKLLGRLLRPKPVFNHKLCRSCGECVRCCPAKAIKVDKGHGAEVELDKCIRCFCCQELCRYKAVKIKKPLLNKLFMSKG